MIVTLTLNPSLDRAIEVEELERGAVVCGSLPPGVPDDVYARLCRRLDAAGIRPARARSRLTRARAAVCGGARQMAVSYTPPGQATGLEANIQRPGAFLAGMIMPPDHRRRPGAIRLHERAADREQAIRACGGVLVSSTGTASR